MALADILRERVSRRGRTAQVDCGELGTVTVEALPPRECAALGMKDGGRALLYAACRELQAAGETLRQERRLFTPDEVTQYVSDGEALAAARTVLALSGVTLDEGADSPDNAENRLETVQDSEKNLSEIRLGVVQQSDIISREAPENRETRLGTVQESVKQFSEIRPGNVQFLEDAPEDGQVSREFSGDGKSVGAIPSMGAVLGFEPQNLALSEENGHFMSPLELSGQMAELHETESEMQKETAGTLHEIESEVPVSLHEITSDFDAQAASPLHEIKSEFRESVHETTSEFEKNRPHTLHETTSELRNDLHETKSETDENRLEGLHEITSELAEQVAQRLLEGLRRAAAVR